MKYLPKLYTKLCQEWSRVQGVVVQGCGLYLPSFDFDELILEFERNLQKYYKKYKFTALEQPGMETDLAAQRDLNTPLHTLPDFSLTCDNPVVAIDLGFTRGVNQPSQCKPIIWHKFVAKLPNSKYAADLAIKSVYCATIFSIQIYIQIYLSCLRYQISLLSLPVNPFS